MYVDPHLPRHIFGWHSPRLGLDMPIVSYGDRGPPAPALAHRAGRLPRERALLPDQGDRAAHLRGQGARLLDRQHQPLRVDEPQRARARGGAAAGALRALRRGRGRARTSAACCGNPHARIGISGASFGAFHAANQFFRRPDLFDTLIAMSGFYDLAARLHARATATTTSTSTTRSRTCANMHDAHARHAPPPHADPHRHRARRLRGAALLASSSRRCSGTRGSGTTSTCGATT